MIEKGLVDLVQGTAAVSAIAATGGFLLTLPKAALLPNWTYFIVSDVPNYTLIGPVELTFRRIQIDCYGNTGQEVIRLANAINTVLSGFSGTLTVNSSPVDTTYVHAIFRSNTIDFFDDAGRTYRRMIEFEIWFDQT